MSEQPDTPTPRADSDPHAPERAFEPPARTPRGRVSRRAAVALSAAMLATGVGVGAAIGPAPSASFAGISPSLLQRLPGLLASIASASRTSAAANSPAAGETSSEEEGASVVRRRRRRHRHSAAAAGASAQEAETGAAANQGTTPSAAKKHGGTGAKLPAISSVWLIELGGESFAQAQAQASSAPYITGTLLHEGTLLSGWNALEGSALASEAALLAPLSEGSSPPLVHSIVQPACPEGAAGAQCSTPAGELAAADAFLKEALAPIVSSGAYREHGLVVVTFASVGVAAEEGLPAGTSSATLTDKPPSGVLVLSPFAKAGEQRSLQFKPTSPSQSLQALLG